MNTILKAVAALFGVLALLASTAVGAASASAPERDGTIHQTLPIAADSFQNERDCGPITEGTAWHFVLNNTTVPTSGSTLTATFEEAGTITAEVHEITGGVTHYFVQTGDGDVLTGAWVSTDDGQLQLSHVCDADGASEVAPEYCPDGETVITDDTDANDDGVADMCEPEVAPEYCPDGETVITDDTDANDDGVADMCEPEVAPEYCPDGETVITDDTDANDDGVADMCEVGIVPGSPDMVTLCHATGNGGYVLITVSQDAVLQEGHGSHEDDIIPPFDGFEGKNLDKLDLLDSGCVVDDGDGDDNGDNDNGDNDNDNGDNDNGDNGDNGVGTDDDDVLGEVIVNNPPVTPATPAIPTVRSATPASPAVQAVAADTSQVLGAQVARSGQLARTGDGTTELVPFGLGLVLLGFGIQRTSKRLSAARVG